MAPKPLPESQSEDLSARAEFSQWIEIRKLLIDYLKHLATLDTASILLIVTFMDKLSAPLRDKEAAVFALLLFIISLLGIALSQLFVIADSNQALKRAKGEALPLRFSESGTGLWAMMAAALGFVFGLIMLAAFALANLIS